MTYLKFIKEVTRLHSSFIGNYRHWRLSALRVWRFYRCHLNFCHYQRSRDVT